MYEEVFPVFMENVYYEKNTQEFQGLFFFPHQNKKKKSQNSVCHEWLEVSFLCGYENGTIGYM